MEFAYSIAEHGLTPATVRDYVRLMTDRMSGLGEVRMHMADSVFTASSALRHDAL